MRRVVAIKNYGKNLLSTLWRRIDLRLINSEAEKFFKKTKYAYLSLVYPLQKKTCKIFI